eukprot:350255-Chlamydomonas_euryale.AAC.25
MFWGAALVKEEDKVARSTDAVEKAISVSTNMYIRHTLPLQQARDAMASKGVKSAVVVDDNFVPMGLAFMADVEEEITRQKERKAVDNNFGRDYS